MTPKCSESFGRDMHSLKCLLVLLIGVVSIMRLMQSCQFMAEMFTGLM